MEYYKGFHRAVRNWDSEELQEDAEDYNELRTERAREYCRNYQRLQVYGSHKEWPDYDGI